MRTRVIQFFKDEQLYLQFDFGTFALMLFYSSKIDPSKAQLFLKLCVSEYTYGSTYNLPIVNEEASQVNHISFDYNTLRSTIFFF